MSKRLSLEETKDCLQKWRELKDENALISLVFSNTGLIGFFAKKNLNKGLTFEELMSVGKESLIRAINGIDYTKYPIEAFSSYISIAIERGMKNEIKKYNKHSHVISFENPIGRNKNGDEMKVEDLIGTDADELLETVISEMKIDLVKNAIKCLTTREMQIILLRYGLDESNRKTQEEVAKIFNCSKNKIIKQEKKALIKMRHPKNTRKLKDFIDN